MVLYALYSEQQYSKYGTSATLIGVYTKMPLTDVDLTTCAQSELYDDKYEETGYKVCSAGKQYIIQRINIDIENHNKLYLIIDLQSTVGCHYCMLKRTIINGHFWNLDANTPIGKTFYVVDFTEKIEPQLSKNIQNLKSNISSLYMREKAASYDIIKIPIFWEDVTNYLRREDQTDDEFMENINNYKKHKEEELRNFTRGVDFTRDVDQSDDENEEDNKEYKDNLINNILGCIIKIDIESKLNGTMIMAKDLDEIMNQIPEEISSKYSEYRENYLRENIVINREPNISVSRGLIQQYLMAYGVKI